MARRSILYFALGALVVAVVVLGYMVYQDNREPDGVAITIGEGGVSVEEK